MLHDNRAEYVKQKSRGVPRDGAALLHGITWCGECGHKMVVRYKGGSQYVCNHLHMQHGRSVPVCQTLRRRDRCSRRRDGGLERGIPG